ncbi:MAG: RHS domain-containing protein, partial [Herminiimonas sp.]|nr:RHS domain-containing protein [Herminiimonas sp.]
MQADGSRIIFSRDPENRSLCSTGNPANGRMQITTTAQGENFAWTWTNGRVLNFNATGKLVQIAAPTGEFVSLQRDARGLLVEVTDPQGRQLKLHYLAPTNGNQASGFRGVDMITSPVGVFGYRYASALPPGSTVDAGRVRANLIAVDYPERGNGRRYHYEDARRPTLLSGISVTGSRDEAPAMSTRIATYLYDVNGRAVLTVRGMPARLQTGKDGVPLKPARLIEGTGIGQVVLDFSNPGRTVLTNSLGQVTTYRHAIIGGEFRLTEVRGAGCFQCGEMNMRYAYDTLGRLVESIRLDRNGQPVEVTRIALDDTGRTIMVGSARYRAGKAQALQWRMRYTYEGDNPAPVVVARPSVVPGREVVTNIAYNDRGQVISVAEHGWTPSGNPQEPASAILRSTTYRYTTINGRSLLSAVDGPVDSAQRKSLSDIDNTRAEWDRDGNYIIRLITSGKDSSTLEYDAAGRVSRVTDDEGKATSFTYNFRSQLLATRSNGVTRVVRYDAVGNAVESGTKDIGRDGEDGVDSDKTTVANARFGFDIAGRNTWIASPLGIISRKRYDTEGNLLEASTQSAHFRQAHYYDYDSAGRLVTGIDPSGGMRTAEWDAQDRPVVETDTLGRQRRHVYDTAGNLAETIEAANSIQAHWQDTTTRFQHDPLGRTTAVIAPSGAMTRTLKDDFGRTVAIISADSGTVTREYNAAGRLTGSGDAVGNAAHYAYDVRGRLTSQTIIDAHATNPTEKLVTTLWRYEGANLVAIDHPEQSERYRYDDQGRLAARDVILHRPQGAPFTSTTQYRYDATGALQSTSLPDGSTLLYRRNGQGQVTAVERSRMQTTWLRWLLPAQPIVRDLERDIVGLKYVTYGNGIQTHYQRSKEGILARVVHRMPVTPAPRSPGVAVGTVLGIGAAHAADADQKTVAALQEKIAFKPLLPGALALPRDAHALIDHRYLWDTEGNLLYAQGKDATTIYAYDAQDRLIVSKGTAASAADERTRSTTSIARYFHDGAGNRLLAQEGISTPADLDTGTVKTLYEAATNRGTKLAGTDTTYNASGQPVQTGERSYKWDATGKLRTVQRKGEHLARYRYNHMGERIGKEVDGRTTGYLYEGRQLAAELDDGGKITRQYVYLADMPVAVIDTPAGMQADGAEPTTWQAVARDLATLWRAWTGSGETIAYLQNDHLGATEAVSNAAGQVIWRAAYGAYGNIIKSSASENPAPTSGSSRFRLNLRLPGQYEDAETGLYYNDHRYYDPRTGRYLTPDPLGLRGGINSYAYVANNPLKYTDPSGLILFAFDGTGNNSDRDSRNIDSTNVALMYGFYDRSISGQEFARYKFGIGSDPLKSVGSNAIEQRIAEDGHLLVTKQLDAFDDYISMNPDVRLTIPIDVIGFSRGAAEARDFSNRLIASYKTNKFGAYCLDFRFMGLFDTVSQFGPNGSK